MKRFLTTFYTAACLLAAIASTAAADEVYPAAILPFQERGIDVKDMGPQVTDLLFANLVANPDMYLVDREDLDKALKELELNLSGMVAPGQAAQVGQLTGAKVLLTGSVLQVSRKLYLVAKIIGTETTRVVGASVKGDIDDDLDTLVEDLAEQVAETIAARADELVAKPKTREDRIAALKKAIGSGKKPVLKVDVEERHIGRASSDPAAETELILFATETGFEVIDPDEGDARKAKILLVGEAFSEFSARHGNLISVKVRVEVKAVEAASGRIVAIDRQTSVGVDLAEQIAAKNALQQAAAEISERMLPKLVETKPSKKSGKKR
jgi:TolB-like protein